MATCTPYTIRQLVDTARWAHENPAGRIRIHFTWPAIEMTGAEWLRWFHDRLHQKIQSYLPRNGRKDTWEWQIETRRAADQLNRLRLRIYWLPRWLEGRFAHRLCRNDD